MQNSTSSLVDVVAHGVTFRHFGEAHVLAILQCRSSLRSVFPQRQKAQRWIQTLVVDPLRIAKQTRTFLRHRFKTLTARNVLRTAPYFHHGAFRTLEQIVDFYDRGGGRGLGLSVPNQDPDVRKRSFSSNEKASLLEFRRVALLDAMPPDTLVLKRMTTK